MNRDSEMKLIIESLLPLCANQAEAESWYYNIVIPSLGCTAEEMVNRGKYKVVLSEIERIKDGGYA